MTVGRMGSPDYRDIACLVSKHHLEIFGGVQANSEDPVPPDTRTVLLLGPAEPGFWSFVSSQHEFKDGLANALDRWSRRAINSLAAETEAASLFPFGGPPYHPFTRWALRSGRCWQSPMRMLVHDTAGLLVSFRGALCLRFKLELPSPPEDSPCTHCIDRPCLGSCPINALTHEQYDAVACQSFVASSRGLNCLAKGCVVRRNCPVSASYRRDQRQSRFHQEAFLKRSL